MAGMLIRGKHMLCYLCENPPYHEDTNSDTVRSSSRHSDILTRDLDIWASDLRGISSGPWEDFVETKSSDQSDTKLNSLTIGYNGIQSQLSVKHGQILFITASAPLASVLAQHILSGFIWAFSAVIPRNAFKDSTVPDSQRVLVREFDPTHKLPTLRSDKMMNMIHALQSPIVWTKEDLLSMLIPALSYRNILPSEQMLEPLLRKAREYEAQHLWTRAADVYSRLLDLAAYPQSGDRMAYLIVVEVIEFLLLVQEVEDDRKDPEDLSLESVNEQARSIICAARRIRSKLAAWGPHVCLLQELFWFYALQRRRKVYRSLISRLQDQGDSDHNPVELCKHHDTTAMYNTILSAPPVKPGQSLMKVVGFSQYHIDVTSEPFGSSSSTGPIKEQIGVSPVAQDIFGWSPLHYAVLCCPDDNVSQRVFEDGQQARDHSLLQNKSGKTLFHHAAVYQPNRLERMIQLYGLGKQAATVTARNGMWPIHYAARSGAICLVKLLKQFVAEPIPANSFGRTILHHGVVSDHIGVVKYLVNDKNVSEPCGDELSRRSPLHFALSHCGNNVKRIFFGIFISFTPLTTPNICRSLRIPDANGVTPLSLIMLECNFQHFASFLGYIRKATLECSPLDDESECFFRMLQIAARMNTQKTMDLLFRHVISRAWEDGFIFEAFLVAHREDLFDKLLQHWLTLANIVPKNVQQKPVPTFNEIAYSAHIEEPAHGNVKEGVSTTPDMLPERVRQFLVSELKIDLPAFMMWSIRHGRTDFIPKAIEAGLFNSESVWEQKDLHGRTALAWLAKAKPTGGSRDSSSRLQILESFWESWNPETKRQALNEHQGETDNTPLIYAAINGYSALVEVFLMQGPTYGQQTSMRRLHYPTHYNKTTKKSGVFSLVMTVQFSTSTTTWMDV
ncbi:ankyrin repeat-containing domain protein [Massariosphaeria phaeospora]|uniref:Ankyrin repeat-containing domain protein n=1 Tax=Massariosphaeria phaeospora TaxID=100035 RepID=A0A7C8M1J7_9PLEO|nr:ankyrin repeat-containing domain protein [Massariosphaeria phaeospora]